MGDGPFVWPLGAVWCVVMCLVSSRVDTVRGAGRGVYTTCVYRTHPRDSNLDSQYNVHPARCSGSARLPTPYIVTACGCPRDLGPTGRGLAGPVLTVRSRYIRVRSSYAGRRSTPPQGTFATRVTLHLLMIANDPEFGQRIRTSSVEQWHDRRGFNLASSDGKAISTTSRHLPFPRSASQARDIVTLLTAQRGLHAAAQ